MFRVPFQVNSYQEIFGFLCKNEKGGSYRLRDIRGYDTIMRQLFYLDGREKEGEVLLVQEFASGDA